MKIDDGEGTAQLFIRLKIGKNGFCVGSRKVQGVLDDGRSLMGNKNPDVTATNQPGRGTPLSGLLKVFDAKRIIKNEARRREEKI